MTTPKHVALMNHVRRTYQLEKDDPVHLHIFNILPKKKETNTPSEKNCRLNINMVCKVLNPNANLDNTGFLNKLVLTLPLFVFFAVPLSMYCFFKSQRRTYDAKLKNAETTIRATSQVKLPDKIVRAQAIKQLSHLSWDYEWFDQFFSIEPIDHIARGSDLTNHQPITIRRYLMAYNNDVKFFSAGKYWKLNVDSFIFEKLFDDFKLQQGLNVVRTFTLENLLKIVESVREPSSGSLAFEVPFVPVAKDIWARRTCNVQTILRFMGENRKGEVDWDSMYEPREQIFVKTFQHREEEEEEESQDGGDKQQQVEEEEYTVCEAQFYHLSVIFKNTACAGRDVIASVTNLWQRLFPTPLSTQKLTKEQEEAAKKNISFSEYYFTSCIFDIEVGLEPELLCARNTFPTFLTGFVQCICFQKGLYKKGLVRKQNVIFVHTPQYYSFSMRQIFEQWRAKFHKRCKFWLGDNYQLVAFESEQDMLAEFLLYATTHVDLLMGYNSAQFDLPFLIARFNFLSQSRNILSICNQFFSGIMSLGFNSWLTPRTMLCIRNQTNNMNQKYYITCDTCRKNAIEAAKKAMQEECEKTQQDKQGVRRGRKQKKQKPPKFEEVRLFVEHASKTHQLPCAKCMVSQNIDLKKIRIEKKKLAPGKRNVGQIKDIMAMTIHLDLMQSEFVQKKCTRRNLETALNTAFQEKISAFQDYDEQSNRLALLLKSKFSYNEDLLKLLAFSVDNIAMTIFYLRSMSNELVRLTNDAVRLEKIWFCFDAESETTPLLSGNFDNNLSDKLIAFQHDDPSFLHRLKNAFDKFQNTCRIRMIIKNVTTNIYQKCRKTFENESLAITVGKTSDIDGDTQRNWTSEDHVSETMFYCFVDTSLTALLESNVKMFTGIFTAELLEIDSGELMFLPSGKRVLPKITRLLAERVFITNMYTPLQCTIVFQSAKHVECISREMLRHHKRLALDPNKTAWRYEKAKQNTAAASSSSSSSTTTAMVTTTRPNDSDLDKFILDKTGTSKCIRTSLVKSKFAHAQNVILEMESHNDAYGLMSWSNDIWNVDECATLGTMGEMPLTLANAIQTANALGQESISPEKKGKRKMTGDDGTMTRQVARAIGNVSKFKLQSIQDFFK